MVKSREGCVETSLLARFLNEETDHQEESRVLAHIDSCATCQASLEKMAAGKDVWCDIRNHFAPHENSVYEADHDLAQRDRHRELDEVAKLLGPTDDPHMIGRLGGYEICGVIGHGGTGIVVKGHDARLNRFVAIKILAPAFQNSGAARQRFEREGRAVAAVSSEHVVPVYGVDEYRGLPFIVMRYIAGGSLQQRIENEGPLETCEVVRIGMQIAGGLAAAHKQGVVHRDVKPANVLLENGADRAMVTDFGLARVAHEAAVTRSGTISGTPQFMSPEQARGESVDPRSDLFSLGSVMYAACTGRAPFDSETLFGVIKKVCEAEPRAIREINPRIDQWLVSFIEKLHRKERDERFSSADEVQTLLAEELAHLQSPTIFPSPSRQWMNAANGWRRKWLVLPAVAISILALIAGTFGWPGNGTAAKTPPGSDLTPRQFVAALQQVGAQPDQASGSINGVALPVNDEKLPMFTKTLEESYNVESGGTLYFDASRGSVEIRTHDSEEVVMRMTRKIRAKDAAAAEELFKKMNLSNALSKRLEGKAKVRAGTDVAIDVRFPERWYSPDELEDVNDVNVLKDMLSLYGLNHFLKMVEFELTVPRSFNLNLVTAGGNVEIPDLRGAVTLRTAGGNIDMGMVTGPVDAETTGGRITAGDIGSRVRAKTAGGRIELGNVSGEVDALTAGGSIILGRVEGAAVTKTSGGSILVGGVGRSLQAVTDAGSIRANFGPQLIGNSVLSTTAGSVKVGLLRESAVEIDARSGGRIKGPFVEGKTSKLQTALNGGGPKLIVSTKVGTIRFEYLDAKP